MRRGAVFAEYFLTTIAAKLAFAAHEAARLFALVAKHHWSAKVAQKLFATDATGDKAARLAK